MNTSVKKWYMEKYPSDELGLDIRNDVNFSDLETTLQVGKDFYGALGVADSIIRERIFSHMSNVTGKSYNYFYNLFIS